MRRRLWIAGAGRIGAGGRPDRGGGGRGRIVRLATVAALAAAVLSALAAPAYAPLGDYIAYSQYGDIHWITPDYLGGPLANTAEAESQPSWDVNQDRVVYVKGEAPGPTDIWLYNKTADNRIQVTFNGRSSNPSIRGNLVTYVREETITAGGTPSPVDQIWTKNLLTHVYTKLTHFKPGQDMGGPPHIGCTAFTPLGEGISFMWGRRWDSRFIRVVGKNGGTVFNVPTDFLGDTRFSWSPDDVTLFYASRDIGGVFKAHSIHRRNWPHDADPSVESTVKTGNDWNWNMNPSVGHQGLSLAYEREDGDGLPGALAIMDWDGGNSLGIVGPAGEPSWLNSLDVDMSPPVAKNLGPASPAFTTPGGRGKLRFRTGTHQTVLPRVWCNIYNAGGGLVRVLGPYAKLIGYGYMYWNGKNGAGHYVAHGTYHYRFRVQDQTGLAAYSSLRNVVVH